VSSTAPISYEQSIRREALSGSGKWAFDNGTHTLFDPRVSPVRRSPAHLAQFAALLLAMSSMSSAPDPWLSTQQQRSLLTMSGAFPTSSRRRITMREALKMADDIMRRAEEGRMKAAEEEAKRGFDWENLT